MKSMGCRMFKLIFQSILNRKFSFCLTIFSIAISIALFVGVERIRLGAQQSFSNTISHTNLVVGARGSGLSLLLNTVFHIGSPNNEISWETYQSFAKNDSVAWTIPLSLGDSFHGFTVVATNENFYEHYRFLGNEKPEMLQGHFSSDLFDITVGSDVAEKENLKLGQKIILSHGVGEGAGLQKHADKPFTVVGILKKSGTPLDRTLYMTMEGDEAMHIDWHNGAPPLPGKETPIYQLKKENIKVDDLTAFLVGTKSPIEALALQREINNYSKEPLTAILPNLTLSELWKLVSYVEIALKIVSLSVIFVGLIGMMVSIFNSLESRRREVAILRAIGTSVKNIFTLLVAESIILSFCGCVLGVFLCFLILILVKPIIIHAFGLDISLVPLQSYEYLYLVSVIIFSGLLGLIPAYQAYKNSLADGLSLRI